MSTTRAHMNPRQNVERVGALRAQVREHPMCLQLREDGGGATVVFPVGDFPVHGLRVGYRDGKAVALERALREMERIWLQSFPGYANP
jgi:hypothetical protein